MVHGRNWSDMGVIPEGNEQAWKDHWNHTRTIETNRLALLEEGRQRGAGRHEAWGITFRVKPAPQTP
jgi:hypothetical protein